MSTKTLYVRVQPSKQGVTSFFRCGMLFIQSWRTLHDVDAATAQRLESEQMLEVTQTRPPELDGIAPAGDSAADTITPASTTAPPASAPTSVDSPTGGAAPPAADTPAPTVPVETAAETTSTATPAPAAPTKPEDPAAVVDAVKAAIAQLDQGNASLFTAAHKPKTDVLAALTGWPVTAAERDAALGE